MFGFNVILASTWMLINCKNLSAKIKEEPKYSLAKILSFVKKSIEYLLLESNSNYPSKFYILKKFETLLYKINIQSVLISKDQTEDGRTVLQLIQSTKDMIEFLYPQQLNIYELIEEITAEFFQKPSEINIKVCCSNLMTKFSEMEELLKRANGHIVNHFESDNSIPFLNTMYVTCHLVPDTKVNDCISIVRHFYPPYKIDRFSRECRESLLLTPKRKCYLDSNKFFMDNYVKPMESQLEDHMMRLRDPNYLTDKILKKMFMTITIYLVMFRTFIDDKHFEGKDEFKRIISNVEGISTMLLSLPLTKILDPSINKWMKVYLKGLIHSTNKILEVCTHLSAFKIEIIKLAALANQLLLMCLKQTTDTSYAVALDVHREIPVPSNNTGNNRTFREEMISLNAKNEWILKFERIYNETILLAKCPYDECFICTEKFVDILNDTSNSNDLAVLPRCPHLVCTKCLEKTCELSESR